MKLQSVKIKTSDFPEEQKEFVETLGGLLNPFIEKLVIGFNKNFTVVDNLPFEFINFQVKVDSNGVATPNIINTNLKGFKGYICVNALNVDSVSPNTTASNCPFLITEVSGNAVKINKITGLPAGVTFNLTLMGIS
jgi:hypothetical protein